MGRSLTAGSGADAAVGALVHQGGRLEGYLAALAGGGLASTAGLRPGDFDGDGRDDLAVSEMESLLGQGEGAVRILYSDASGLLGAGATPAQLIYDFSAGAAGSGVITT